MGQRNMAFTGQMIDNEIDHHPRIHPEPGVVPFGRIATFRQPNDHPSQLGTVHGLLPSGLDTTTFMVAPPGPTRVVPVPVTPGLQNQILVPTNQVMDGFNGAFKGKIAGGYPVNFRYFYPAPGSTSFVVPEYRGFDVIPVVMGPGNHRGPRNRAVGAIGLDHPGVQLMPLSHGAQPQPQPQPIQVVPAPWLDPQFRGNATGIPYMQGYANGFQVMTANRTPVAFVQPPPAAAPMPPVRGAPNMGFNPHLASTSRVVPIQNGVELVPRFVGPAPPVGVRVYQPRRHDLMVESTPRHRGLPAHLRVLPEDGVAMLDISNYGHRVDHHRDMRLDIDHMSYEELLALGEQIGNAGSSLSDDFILGHLKTRIFTISYSEDGSAVDQELNFCTICQMDYNDREKIGMLDCSHEYHVDCIKKWLAVKNSCPVCKCTALATPGGNDSGNREEP